MSSRFRITIGSDPDHEDLVGDLYFDDQIVCVLTQEAGIDAVQIELFPPSGGGTWSFALAEFEEALRAVKQRLWELRRADP